MRLDSAREETITNLSGSRKFTMTASPKAFQILSSGIYERKIEAIVRELSCNAYDSHVMAGKVDEPFVVTLPSAFNSQFSVEDFGVGLTEDEVYDVYTTYFASTKTQSNDVIGALGLGSKTPFSYTDSFTIVARKDGKECTFTASIGQSGEPEVVKLFERPWLGSNGVKVTVEVASRDIREFVSCAEKVYSWFLVKPTLSREIEYDLAEDVLENIYTYGYHFNLKDRYSYRNECKVLMGNVAYSLDLSTLKDSVDTNLDEFISSIEATKADLFFSVNIGDVDVAASRETLSLDDNTKENLRNRLREIQKSFEANTKDKALKMDSVFEVHFTLTPMERKAIKDVKVKGHSLSELNADKFLSTTFRNDADAALAATADTYDVGFFGDFSDTGRRMLHRSKRRSSVSFENIVEKDSLTGKYCVTVVINDCPRKVGIKGAVKENTSLPRKVLVVSSKNSTLTPELETLLDRVTYGSYQVVYASSFWDGKLSSGRSSTGGLADTTVRANILMRDEWSMTYRRYDFEGADVSRWIHAAYDGCNDAAVSVGGVHKLFLRSEIHSLLKEFDLDGLVAHNATNKAKVGRIIPTDLGELLTSKISRQDCRNSVLKHHLSTKILRGLEIVDGFSEFKDQIQGLTVAYPESTGIMAKAILGASEVMQLRKSIDNRLEVFYTSLEVIKNQSSVLRCVLNSLDMTDEKTQNELQGFLEYLNKQRKEK